MALRVRSACPFMDAPRPAIMRADLRPINSSCGVGFFLTFSLLTFSAGFLSYAFAANPLSRWALLQLMPATANMQDAHGFAYITGVLNDGGIAAAQAVHQHAHMDFAHQLIKQRFILIGPPEALIGAVTLNAQQHALLFAPSLGAQ